MAHFSGQVFVTTRWSMYQVKIPSDLASRPTVQKWASRVTSQELGRDLHVPVTGTFRNGYHIAITSRGLFQYHMPPAHTGPPLPFELVPGVFRATRITQTTPIVALFLDHAHAEECHASSRCGVGPGKSFNPLWWSDTKKTLIEIGPDHPLVVISTNPGNRFGVPAFLWNPEVEFPQVDR